MAQRNRGQKRFSARNFPQSRPFKNRHDRAEYRQHGLNPKHEMPVTARRGKYRVSLQNGGLAKLYRSLKESPSFRPTALKALAVADTEGGAGQRHSLSGNDLPDGRGRHQCFTPRAKLRRGRTAPQTSECRGRLRGQCVESRRGMPRDVPLAGRHRLAGEARRFLPRRNPRDGGQHGRQRKTGFPRTHGDFFKPPGRNEPLRRLGREKERGDLFPCGERGQHRGIPGERVQIQNVRSLIFGDVGHDTWPQAGFCVGALGIFIVSVNWLATRLLGERLFGS